MSICRSWIIWIYCFSSTYKYITCQKLPRIAGGKNADIKDFPFMVTSTVCKYRISPESNFLIISSRNKFMLQAALISKRQNEHLCGGSIISKMHILTAAHCFEECRDGVEKHIFESDEIYVRVGSTKWNHGGQIYDVDDRLRHQKYVTYGIKDIAIIKIKGEFSFSDTVKIIPIAQRSKVPSSKGEVTLAGWGRIQYNIIASPEVLQKTEHEITPQKECKKYYYEIASSHICTIHKGKSSGACPGDSGGPVIYKGQLIGIMVGIVKGDCLTMIAPHVHTKVISYKKWIETYLKGS